MTTFAEPIYLIFCPICVFGFSLFFLKKNHKKKLMNFLAAIAFHCFRVVPIHEVDYLIPEFYIFFRSAVSFQRRNLPYCVFLRVLSSCCAIHHFTNIIMSLETKNPTSPYCWLLMFFRDAQMFLIPSCNQQQNNMNFFI